MRTQVEDRHPESGWSARRFHFVGIGGAGMSGLALVCHELGATVSGSDRADSSYMERLRAAGLEPAVGHDAANLPDGAEVVVSTAIADDNPELRLANERGLLIRHRGELLAELCNENGKRLIAVAGTHGKTTTTAMIVWALRALGASPAFFVGGEVPGLGPGSAAVNAAWGSGEWVVAEADESDASFLDLKPEIAVVTNVEMDHHSRWGSIADLTEAFRKFLVAPDAVALPFAANVPVGRIRDFEGPADILYGEAKKTKQVVRFTVEAPGPQELDLKVRGRHNLLNARAALAAVALADLDVDSAAASLRDFLGVGRRLEYKGESAGAQIYDDYAHHPTEVRAVLEALREQQPAWLIAVFQPHLYSRTKALVEQFGAALALADEVVVLDVYAAREEPVGELAGVSGLDVARATCDRIKGKKVVWAPTHEEALGSIERSLAPGDVLVTIGAGDVFQIAETLVQGRAGG
jgi:UDP-N-acetylmuramate--alanine ligase